MCHCMAGLFAVTCLTCVAPAIAYETDQFTNRAAPLADSTDVLNGKVNDTLEEIIAEWRTDHDEMAFVDAFYHKLGGVHWVDKLERWAMKSPAVQKSATGRYEGVFAEQPFWAARVASVFGIGKTIRLNHQLIGTDKIGHFISQGRKYYRRYVKYGSEQLADERSALTERGLFGRMANGTYSNADLVANYEGHRFFRSLFEDDIVAGKKAILGWENGSWVIQREFDWADHVNEYWDEALNINHYDALLYKYMRRTLISMCPNYWEHPALYRIEDEDALKARYEHLQLIDASELRLDSLCPVQKNLAIKEEISSQDVPVSP